MFLKLIKQSWIFIIIIGSITLGAFYITGAFNFNNVSIIQQHTSNIMGYTWNYYTIDLKLYLTNIENSVNVLTLPTILPEIPQFPVWPTLSSNPVDYGTNILEVVKFIAKTLITIVNTFIYILNLLLLTPIKLLLYPIRIIITLIGLNTSDLDFINVINTIANVNIPYIPINF